MKRRSSPSTDSVPLAAMHVIRFQTERFVGDTVETARSDMQILMILYGSATVIHPEGEEKLESGDLVSVRPGVRILMQNAQALQVVRCTFNPRILRRRLGDAFDAKALYILSEAQAIRRYELPIDRFRSIAAMLSAAVAGGDMGNIGRTLLLLEAVVEHGRTQVPKIHGAVFKAIQTFDEDLSKDWTLPEIAATLDLDPSYVARLFKSGIGMPPLAYLALLRAEEAASLLMLSTMSCSSVGDQVGWADANYFSRRFRQHFGESPTAFRERALRIAG